MSRTVNSLLHFSETARILLERTEYLPDGYGVTVRLEEPGWNSLPKSARGTGSVSGTRQESTDYERVYVRKDILGSEHGLPSLTRSPAWLWQVCREVFQ